MAGIMCKPALRQLMKTECCLEYLMGPTSLSASALTAYHLALDCCLGVIAIRDWAALFCWAKMHLVQWTEVTFNCDLTTAQKARMTDASQGERETKRED